MFCIICGERATVGNFCDKHFLEKNELFILDDIELFYCRFCGKYTDKSSGKEYTENEIEDIILDNIKTENQIESIDIKKRMKGTYFMIEVEAKGHIIGCKTPKTEKKNIEIRVKKRKCEICSKMSGNYHEAVIQIRGERKTEIVDFVKRNIRKDSGVSIEDVKNGFNVKFISKKDAKKLSLSLKKRYDVIESYKLAGVKKGEKLYRNFYSVK